MNQLPHIEFATLADFVEDRLDAGARADVQAHLSACADCAGQAAQLGEVTGLMRGDAMEDAPRYARIAATNLFRARRQTAKRPAESSLRRVLAALKFDSLGMTPAFGIRSAAATERQLLFTAYDNELHLQIAPAAERWQITGQVLGPCAGGAVELRGADETLSVTLNELCEFTLAPVVAGTYALRLRLGDVEMEIPELLVGESKG